MTTPLWQPSKKNVEQTQLYQFMQKINQSHSLSLSSYSALHQWSVTHSEHFWVDLWDYCQVIGSKGEEPYLIDNDKMPGAQWFPSAKINFAENLLRFRDDRTALIFRNESNTRIEISYEELYARVTQFASGLKALNVKKGDVVAGLLPNLPDAVIAMLAATSLGAIWT